jgi:hypothetical protein
MEITEVSAGLGQVVHRQKGVRVLVAEHPPKTDQSLLVEVAGAMEIAQGPVGSGEIVHRT